MIDFELYTVASYVASYVAIITLARLCDNCPVSWLAHNYVAAIELH